MRRTALSSARQSAYFFFQAEDGIRDSSVTGVQTCALPILGDDVELIELVLVFVEQRRIEAGHPIDVKVRRLPRIVGNLKAAVRYAAHEGQAAGGVEHRRKIEKSLFLGCAVVNSFVRRRRILYSQIILEIAS